jgi:hypothetical protein
MVQMIVCLYSFFTEQVFVIAVAVVLLGISSRKGEGSFWRYFEGIIGRPRGAYDGLGLEPGDDDAF